MCPSGPLGYASIIPTAAGQRPLNTALGIDMKHIAIFALLLAASTAFGSAEVARGWTYLKVKTESSSLQVELEVSKDRKSVTLLRVWLDGKRVPVQSAAYSDITFPDLRGVEIAACPGSETSSCSILRFPYNDWKDGLPEWWEPPVATFIFRDASFAGRGTRRKTGERVWETSDPDGTWIEESLVRPTVP
jgi:hypothetical protein